LAKQARTKGRYQKQKKILSSQLNSLRVE